MAKWKAAAGAATVLGLALQYLLSVPTNLPIVSCEEFGLLCNDQIAEGAPPEVVEKNETEFPFGRWKNPQPSLNALKTHGSKMQRFFQRKKWSYVSVSTDKYHLAITPVHFNYVEDVYLSVVEKGSGKVVFDYHWQMPFSNTLSIAPESTHGCTSMNGWWGENIQLCFQDNTWNFDIAMKGLKANIKILKGQDALILWYPLGSNTQRPAYVHKEAGMSAHGQITVGDSLSYSFSNGAANLDWTETFALRETKWNWVSWACATCVVKETVDGSEEISSTTQKPVGINLSKKVYDVHTSGKMSSSSENAIWIDHKVIPLNIDVEIVMPEGGPTSGPWLIKGEKEGKYLLDMKFEPHGIREDHTGSRFLGIVSDFVQPYGSFTGTVSVAVEAGRWLSVQVEGAYGVCEDHLAIW